MYLGWWLVLDSIQILLFFLVECFLGLIPLLSLFMYFTSITLLFETRSRFIKCLNSKYIFFFFLLLSLIACSITTPWVLLRYFVTFEMFVLFIYLFIFFSPLFCLVLEVERVILSFIGFFIFLYLSRSKKSSTDFFYFCRIRWFGKWMNIFLINFKVQGKFNWITKKIVKEKIFFI